MRPEATKKIQGIAKAVTADQWANILLKCMGRGEYIITTELLFELTNITFTGSWNRNNLLL